MVHIKTQIKQGLTIEQLNEALPYASAVVKQVLGVANNMAQVAMFNARDDIKQHPRFKHQIKQAFNQAFKAWEEYESRLLNPVGVRYFHVEDMPPQVRKRYGNITDREYYEFWQNVGWSIYAKYRNYVTALDHKFELSLQKHDVPHAELICKAMTAEQLLNMAEARYRDALKTVHQEFGLPDHALNILYEQFNLHAVHERWAKAMILLVPNFSLEEIEEKNIMTSIKQLYEVIADIPEMYDGRVKSVEDYEEVYRTKGEWKKALRELREDANETKELLNS